jgi:membrane fusion protein (multidrug efflux system)
VDVGAVARDGDVAMSVSGRCAAGAALAAALLACAAPPHDAAHGESATAAVAVHGAQVTRATLRAYVVAYGVVEPEPPTADHPAASARVASPVPGVVATVSCVEGGRVTRGAELFRLDTRVTDAAVAKAAAALDYAEQTLARQERLMAVDGTSRRQLQDARQQVALARSELAAARAQRALQSITAPLTGTVTRLSAKPGEAVDLNTVLAEIIDLDRLVVTANVPSTELPAVRLGQPVELGASRVGGGGELPAATIGTVVFIGRQIDAKTDTAPVRIAIPPGSDLLPGQFVRARVVTEERTGRLAVPVESVVKTEAGPVVAVVEGERAVQKQVRLGLRDGGRIEIAGDDLREGMTVVTQGVYGLPNDAVVQVTGDGAVASAPPAGSPP